MSSPNVLIGDPFHLDSRLRGNDKKRVIIFWNWSEHENQR